MNPSSLKFRRTRKIIMLALSMLCASNTYSMEDKKNIAQPGSDCIFGRYSVWEVDPDAQENTVPYVLVSQLIDESIPGNTFFALFLMLVQAVTQ